MDAGSYAKEIIEVVASNSKLFYIRANRSEDLYAQLLKVEKRESVKINYKMYETASIAFTQFFEERKYRLVIMREKTNDPQLNIFTGDNHKYCCILILL